MRAFDRLGYLRISVYFLQRGYGWGVQHLTGASKLRTMTGTIPAPF
jgi:hypothetical protein